MACRLRESSWTAFHWGNKSEAEEQALYVVGNPEQGGYKLKYGESEETVHIAPVEDGTTALVLEEAINGVLGAAQSHGQ